MFYFLREAKYTFTEAFASQVASIEFDLKRFVPWEDLELAAKTAGYEVLPLRELPNRAALGGGYSRKTRAIVNWGETPGVVAQYLLFDPERGQGFPLVWRPIVGRNTITWDPNLDIDINLEGYPLFLSSLFGATGIVPVVLPIPEDGWAS